MVDEAVSDVERSDVSGKTCFVIMPFGHKRDILSDGQVQDIDFDQVYRQIIKPTVERLMLRCTRADEVSKSGLIHKDMIERILNSDLVVVDITTLNANVFYELGIRHTARLSGTVLVRMANKPIPFNIGGMFVSEYQGDSPEAISHSQDISKRTFATASSSGTSIAWCTPSSPDYASAAGRRQSRSLKFGNMLRRKSARSSSGSSPATWCKFKAWMSGSNPENTRMEMARLHDNSISACIRYFGAKRSPTGHVERDTIAAELRKRIGPDGMVEPGIVIPTSAGELRRSHGVKVILHVAGQHGEPGRGYLPIRNYAGASSMRSKPRIN